VGGLKECKASTSFLTSAIVWPQSSGFDAVPKFGSGLVAMAVKENPLKPRS
jgi:hypothetical protein